MAKLTEEQIRAAITKNPKHREALSDTSDTSVSLGDIDDLSSSEAIYDMKVDVVSYNRMLRERRVFINDSLTNLIPFTRENLYVICAYSGSGKSTIAANIAYPLWQQQKKILFLSNEETSTDIMMRIGSLHLGLNFNDYKMGQMPPIPDQKNVISLFDDIRQYVKIIDASYKDGLTTKLEGIKSALTAVQEEQDYACVLIDYYQLIKYSIYDKSKSTYDVLNDLRVWLGRYIKKSKIPVVLFAQLHSQSKRQGKDLDTRIKHCSDIIEPATVVIEVIPNFENQYSNFILHKNRFGVTGKSIKCGYVKGRFVDYTPQFERMVLDNKIGELTVGKKNIQKHEDGVFGQIQDQAKEKNK